MSSTGAASTSAVAANNAEDSVDYENDLDMNDEDRELEAMKARVREMEAEAAKLREMQAVAERAQNGTSNTDGTSGQTGDAAGADGSEGASATPGPTDEEKEAVDSRSIYVGNVDYGATPEEIQQHFASCATINRVTILCDKFTGHPKGYAYIEFAEPSLVQNSMLLNESMFRGRLLKVTPKRTNVPHFMLPGAGGRGRGRGRGAPRGGRGYHPYSRPRGRGRGRGH